MLGPAEVIRVMGLYRMLVYRNVYFLLWYPMHHMTKQWRLAELVRAIELHSTLQSVRCYTDNVYGLLCGSTPCNDADHSNSTYEQSKVRDATNARGVSLNHVLATLLF